MRSATYLPLLAGIAAACSITRNVKTTFYGVPDNDPAGSDAIAYSCSARGYHAGGVGTYNDPLTFASKQGSGYRQCEIVYFPYLKKYIRNEDICASCSEYLLCALSLKTNTAEWVDVFTGNSQNGGAGQVNCENQLTPNAAQTVIRDPATNLEVDTTPLWISGTCNTGHVYHNNNAANYCGGNPNPNPTCQTGCSWAGHCTVPSPERDGWEQAKHMSSVGY
ncbi:hypothetical protein NUW58_g1748 [Xylaria curta]|uniref:Uncharacterized protein n=2 Tax=Xylaria curta TaxID=42375 RepID=A0ACC1PIX3_9PEZI|nr:hypothetical protein NUW58_g6390 [Xylaria curta]KAJ2993761.1 hypothetical protein NUW58_g1748 [Xylaria curta]